MKKGGKKKRKNYCRWERKTKHTTTKKDTPVSRKNFGIIEIRGEFINLLRGRSKNLLRGEGGDASSKEERVWSRK